jgi:hypothetical protein
MICATCCMACIEKRVHTEEEWKNHPYARHGFENGKWSHLDLEKEHQEKQV